MSIAAPLVAEPRAAPRAAPTSYASAPLALAVATFALCAFAPGVLNDGDTFSHVATGEWILQHRAVPHVDPFSFSFAGAPWTAHEWLSELLLALAYRASGWGGVMLLTGVAAGAAIYIVARVVVDRLAGPAALVLSLGALALIAPGLLARPHILALPFFALWAAALMNGRERGQAPPMALAGVMWIWANLHGGYAFGLALILPFAVEAVWRADRDSRLGVAQRWLLFFCASLIAALATPFGLEGLLLPFRLLGNAQIANIGEWRAEDFSHPGPLEVVLLGLLGVAFLKSVRLDVLSALLLVGLVHMSLQHSRHEMLLAVLAPMLLARPVAEAFQAAQPVQPSPKGLTIAFLAGALALAGVRLALPVSTLDTASAPSRALAAVSPDLRNKNVLNGYGFGGYLIFAKVRPFIDGRADMFGAEFMSLYQRVASGDAETIEATLKRYEIAWTMLPPSSGAVAVMDREPGWKRLYSDSRAVIHVRGETTNVGLRGD